jgi:hypothetical protein
MIMQLNRIAAAIAAGTALHIGTAFALEPSVTPDIEIFMSGATAQDGNLELLFQELCIADTLDVYLDNSNPSSLGSAHRAYFCQLDSSKVTGLSQSNPKVLLHKRAKGGSAQGVNPVLDEQAIDAMAINNGGNCVQDGANRRYLCRISEPGDLIQKVSDAGVSDVNPEMFRGVNNPDGSAPVNPLKVAERMEVVSGGALVFNTPVTLKLRNALQRAQIEQGRLAAGCEGRENTDCMPSLNKHLVASLFTGNIGKWEEIKVVLPDGSSKPLTDYKDPADTIDPKAHLCRRVNGSGTQAQFNAKFLNTPCTDSALAPLETSNKLAGPVVVLNSGSGDVDTCLHDYDQATPGSPTNTTGVTAWAIGIQSTEKNTKQDKAYRFIKIDGSAPTLENASAGQYMDFAEVTYQWRKPAFNGPTGDVLTIIEKIASDAGKPSIMAKNNTKFVHGTGADQWRGGYLAVSSSGHPVPADGVFDPNNPVTPYTHAPGGLSLDNCRVPVVDGKKPNRL